MSKVLEAYFVSNHWFTMSKLPSLVPPEMG